MIPDCGPPINLSPENNVTWLPDKTLSCTVGSCSIPYFSVLIKHPDPRSLITFMSYLFANCTNSSNSGLFVKPIVLKLLG